MKKKVLFLITKATWGGAQRYVYDAATQLSKEEYEPIVVYGQKGLLAEKLQASGIERREILSLGRDIALVSDIVSFFQIWACIRTIRPNIIHLNSSKAAALGALAARLAGVQKIIFTVHGWPFKEHRSSLARGAIFAVSWLTALLSHEVHVVSRSDEEIGKRMWGIEKKIHYIALTTAPEFLSRKDAEDALFLSTPEPRIVTIAELTPNKGLRYAIQAIAQLKVRGVDVSYFIIGDGEEKERLTREIDDREISSRVHFLGFMPDAARYLKAFDVFLLPSIKEGMPYVLLEAAQAQLPIITTKVVDPEFLEKNPNVTVLKPRDSRAIAEAIIQALNPAH